MNIERISAFSLGNKCGNPAGALCEYTDELNSSIKVSGESRYII